MVANKSEPNLDTADKVLGLLLFGGSGMGAGGGV